MTESCSPVKLMFYEAIYQAKLLSMAAARASYSGFFICSAVTP
jgi:hypothetical protein